MRQIARFIALGYIAIVIAAVTLQATGLVRFSAPLNLIPAPERPPIVVNILYSAEKRDWLRAAAEQFTATGPTVRGRPIQLVLREQGSQAMIDSIVQNRERPAAIMPASNAQLMQLERSGTTVTAGSGPNAPQAVALSPLVLVGWSDRVDALFPQGSEQIWQQLHDSQAKFGHASPRTDNSGIETLVLLAYAYHGKAQGLTLDDINDPGFQSWLLEIESNIVDRPFLDSTDNLFSAFLQKGRSAYDIVTVYESQALRRSDRLRNGELRVLYPPATTLSDHPFVVLEASWATPEEQEGARLFRNFLLGEPAQRLARQYGFRPVNAAVSLAENEPNNPFPTAFDAGIQQELPGTVAAPEPEVLDALKTFWQQQANR
jgi:ABC-type Fe3+ transport system substrate-binding protein